MLLFRNAEIEDAPVILNFLRKLASYEDRESDLKISEEGLTEALSNKETKLNVLICEIENFPAGMALWQKRFSPYSGGFCMLIVDLFIDEEHRGKGIGNKFFEELKGKAQENNCVKLEWFVDANNIQGQNFYKKIGGFPLDNSCLLYTSDAADE